jgi:NADH dehydrogenase
MDERARPHVVIVGGGGFGGLNAARALAHAPVRVTVVDRENHHLFQPLLYQVATAGLSATDIASPIRSILRKQENTTVLLASAKRIDLRARRVVLDVGEELAYDFLIFAVGSANNYFGHPEWAASAPGLKSLDDALEIRRRILLAFEAAERDHDAARRAAFLSFAVVGGGPTGVELAGAIAELAKRALRRDFRTVDPTATQIHLIEAGSRILPTFDEGLAERGREELGELGVNVITGARVVGIDSGGVALDGGGHIRAGTTIWTAGVRPSELAESMGLPLVKGRVRVRQDLSVPEHPEAFVIGDLAEFEQDGKILPGLGAVATQQGRAAADAIERTVRGRPRRPFRYRDWGVMATVGRSRAIADIKGVRLSGFLAWVVWLTIHIVLLIGFRNRVVVLFTWAWSYVTFRRGARVITGLDARAQLGEARPFGEVPFPRVTSFETA